MITKKRRSSIDLNIHKSKVFGSDKIVFFITFRKFLTYTFHQMLWFSPVYFINCSVSHLYISSTVLFLTCTFPQLLCFSPVYFLNCYVSYLYISSTVMLLTCTVPQLLCFSPVHVLNCYVSHLYISSIVMFLTCTFPQLLCFSPVHFLNCYVSHLYISSTVMFPTCTFPQLFLRIYLRTGRKGTAVWLYSDSIEHYCSLIVKHKKIYSKKILRMNLLF